MLATLRKLLALLDARQRVAWLSLVPLAALGSALEAITALGVLALIQLLADPGAAERDTLVRRVAALAPGASHESLVALFALGIAGLSVSKNGLRLVEAWARARCAARATAEFSTRLLRAYLAAPYAFHLRRGSAELLHNALSLADNVARGSLHSVTVLLSEGLVVAAMLAVLLQSAPGVALAVGLAAAAVMVLLLRATHAHHRRWGERAHALNAALVRELQESLAGVKEVKAFGREASFARGFGRAREALARVLVRRGAAETAPRLVVETLLVLGVAGAIVVTRGRGDGDLVPLLGLFAYAGLRVLPSLHWMVHHANELRFAASAIDALHADWTELGAGARGAGDAPEPEPLPFQRAIRFEGVRFGYAGGAGPVLRGVDLEIPRGSSLGIVGPTGVGKSTLVDLLLGLLAPDAGRILIDGAELAGRERAWQRQIGYVPQAIHLLDASVRRNVAFGVPEPEIDDARVSEALALAQLSERVAALPDGAETRIGERGVRLSGGERARLALARALYRDSELLVLDEATAALDHASERAVARAIEGLQRRKTLVIVAHRPSTVMGCDRIALLHAGRITDQGSWVELAARHPELRLAASA